MQINICSGPYWPRYWLDAGTRLVPVTEILGINVISYGTLWGRERGTHEAWWLVAPQCLSRNERQRLRPPCPSIWSTSALNAYSLSVARTATGNFCCPSLIVSAVHHVLPSTRSIMFYCLYWHWETFWYCFQISFCDHVLSLIRFFVSVLVFTYFFVCISVHSLFMSVLMFTHWTPYDLLNK